MRSYQITDRYILLETGTVISNCRLSPVAIKPKLKPNGYLTTTVRYNLKMYDYYLHRLLAIAFIPKPPGKDFVNHKDLNKQNNRLDNLEWCTPKENTQHYFNTRRK